jgi:hypothetical protein
VRETWEGCKIVWRREPLMVVAVVTAVIAALLAIIQMFYALLT